MGLLGKPANLGEDLSSFKKEVKENVRKLDQGAIDLILALDAEGFHHYIQKTGATICGYLPISLLLRTLKRSIAAEGHLVNYYTSGDVVGDYANSVSYAALAFYEKR